MAMDGIHDHDKENGEKKISKLESLKVFLQKGYVKAALVLALTGTGAFVAHQAFKDKEQNKIEHIKELRGYPFLKHHLKFRDDNKDFFVDSLDVKTETLVPGVVVKRDAGLTFYVVQKEDIRKTKETVYERKTQKIKKGKQTITKKVRVPKTKINVEADFGQIRDKLSDIAEFSYLNDAEYDRSNPDNKIKSFNVPKRDVIPGMYIPIPLDHKAREISPMDFANYCYDAIQEMKTDTNNPYFKDIQEILSCISEKEFITTILSFARSETAGEYTNFISPFGDAEIHRREPRFKAFSFTYFHILMEKNADKETPGPGLDAREKLGFTEGQCYHPKNGVKLFIGYYVEKKKTVNKVRANKGKKPYERKDLFPITKKNVKIVAQIYNGSADYAIKLQPNHEYCQKLMNGEIVYYDNKNLKKIGFDYAGLNSKYEHIYRFKTPKGITSNDKLKRFIVEEFNKNKAADCPAIGEDDVVTQKGKEISGKIIPDTTIVRVPKK